MGASELVEELRIEEAYVDAKPFYVPVGDEIDVARQACGGQLPLLLKGPTGCGKTRFVEYLTWLLSQRGEGHGVEPGADGGGRRPLVTINCHEDLTATDLVGRYLLHGDRTEWMDGPLTRAVRSGGVCYLDEIVEARNDTTVILHSLTDHRRVLPIDKLGTLVRAHPAFQLVVSFNPGYQSSYKDMKRSTRQRFVSLDFCYPAPETEARIVETESGCDGDVAARLAELAVRIRNLEEHPEFQEPSTRLLVHAGVLIARGVPARRACGVAITHVVSDDAAAQSAISDLVHAYMD